MQSDRDLWRKVQAHRAANEAQKRATAADKAREGRAFYVLRNARTVLREAHGSFNGPAEHGDIKTCECPTAASWRQLHALLNETPEGRAIAYYMTKPRIETPHDDWAAGLTPDDLPELYCLLRGDGEDPRRGAVGVRALSMSGGLLAAVTMSQALKTTMIQTFGLVGSWLPYESEAL